MFFLKHTCFWWKRERWAANHREGEFTVEGMKRRSSGGGWARRRTARGGPGWWSGGSRGGGVWWWSSGVLSSSSSSLFYSFFSFSVSCFLFCSVLLLIWSGRDDDDVGSGCYSVGLLCSWIGRRRWGMKWCCDEEDGMMVVWRWGGSMGKIFWRRTNYFSFCFWFLLPCEDEMKLYLWW